MSSTARPKHSPCRRPRSVPRSHIARKRGGSAARTAAAWAAVSGTTLRLTARGGRTVTSRHGSRDDAVGDGGVHHRGQVAERLAGVGGRHLQAGDPRLNDARRAGELVQALSPSAGTMCLFTRWRINLLVVGSPVRLPSHSPALGGG